jgi:hypothetical protein
VEGVTLAEIVVVGAVVYGIYRLLGPVTRRLERMILRLLDPERAAIVDVKPEAPPKHKSKKKED